MRMFHAALSAVGVSSELKRLMRLCSSISLMSRVGVMSQHQAADHVLEAARPPFRHTVSHHAALIRVPDDFIIIKICQHPSLIPRSSPDLHCLTAASTDITSAHIRRTRCQWFLRPPSFLCWQDSFVWLQRGSRREYKLFNPFETTQSMRLPSPTPPARNPRVQIRVWERADGRGAALSQPSSCRDASNRRWTTVSSRSFYSRARPLGTNGVCVSVCVRHG